MAPTYFDLFVICLVVLTFLYQTSHKFRYYFKFAVYYSVSSTIALMLIPASLYRPFDVKNVVFYRSYFARYISKLVGVKFEVRGKEHLEKDQACVIVANHQSSLDALGMIYIWSVMNKCTVLVRRELFYVWPLGLALWLWGFIFIDRKKPESAREQLNNAMNYIKNEKIKLWMFPEGTRRNTGELHSFKKGAFHAAVNAQIPILPVVFSSYTPFLNDEKKDFKNGHIIITTLPPISTASYTKLNIDQLIQHTHDTMNKTLQLTSKEVIEIIPNPINNNFGKTNLHS